MSGLPVLSVVSEIFPLVKTGGLADVAGALPAALAPEGIAMRSLVPGYPAVLAALEAAETVYTAPWLFGGPARVLAGRGKGLDLFVLDAPHLYGRAGNPYSGPDGRDWVDNGLRFAALARIGASLARGALGNWTAAAVQAHDWQAGLLPAFLHYDGGRRPGTVMTVHNLAFQGQFALALAPRLGLPAEALQMDGVEYYGNLGFLKAGLRFADRISTVSPNYAAEIRTQQGGMGLGGLLRHRSAALVGILNGIDEEVWNPAQDALIAARYDADRLEARAVNKTMLQQQFGLAADPDAPLFGVVSRLTWHKGIDLLLTVLPTLQAVGGQLAVLGAGDGNIQHALASATFSNVGRVGCRFGYDERIAHLIQAGADALIVPSRSEPCGLTQLCALRYGAVPVVARVGGLADTVIDASPMALAAGAATGVQFAPVTSEMLESALLRAAALYRDRPTWAVLQRNGMATDVSWRGPARQYAALLREAAAAAAR
jgi:starch synthase